MTMAGAKACFSLATGSPVRLRHEILGEERPNNSSSPKGSCILTVVRKLRGGEDAERVSLRSRELRRPLRGRGTAIAMRPVRFLRAGGGQVYGVIVSDFLRVPSIASLFAYLVLACFSQSVILTNFPANIPSP